MCSSWQDGGCERRPQRKEGRQWHRHRHRLHAFQRQAGFGSRGSCHAGHRNASSQKSENEIIIIIIFFFVLSRISSARANVNDVALLLCVQMYDRAISAPTSPTKMEQSGKRSWEEPAWMGSSPRVLNSDMKSTVSRSLQSLPTSSRAFEPGGENAVLLVMRHTSLPRGCSAKPAAKLVDAFCFNRHPVWRNLALLLQWVLTL